jgi:hypothetical protein
MDSALRQRLLDDGWEERFSASGARLEEAAAQYRSLGYEVRTEGLVDVASGVTCTQCFTVPGVDGPSGVLFTRAATAPLLEEEDLFGE